MGAAASKKSPQEHCVSPDRLPAFADVEDASTRAGLDVTLRVHDPAQGCGGVAPVDQRYELACKLPIHKAVLAAALLARRAQRPPSAHPLACCRPQPPQDGGASEASALLPAERAQPPGVPVPRRMGVKVGAPFKSSFAETHPGWDQRVMINYSLLPEDSVDGIVLTEWPIVAPCGYRDRHSGSDTVYIDVVVDCVYQGYPFY